LGGLLTSRRLLILQIVTWSFFGLYLLYRFTLEAPGYSVLVLGIALAIGWPYWRDLMAGVILRLDIKLKPGRWIRIADKQGKLKSIGLRKLLLETGTDEIEVIPNHRISKAGYTLLSGPAEEGMIEILTDQETVDALGGFDRLRTKAAASPWASKTWIPQIEYVHKNRIKLIARAFSPESKAQYLNYLTILLNSETTPGES
jgi:hypothetical protein